MTALLNPAQLKWKDKVAKSLSLPTPWPKQVYEEYSREIQQRRAQLRTDRRPEEEMNALFREELAHTTELFSKAPHQHTVGAFEGANYEASGYYRPEMQCLMFDRSNTFCSVCQDAISSIIDLYTRTAVKK